MSFKVSLHFYKIAVFLLDAMAHGNSTLNGIILSEFSTYLLSVSGYSSGNLLLKESCEQDLIRLGSRGC